MRIAPGYIPPQLDGSNGRTPLPRRDTPREPGPPKDPAELAKLMHLLKSSAPRTPSLSADEREFLEMRHRECGG